VTEEDAHHPVAAFVDVVLHDIKRLRGATHRPSRACRCPAVVARVARERALRQ